MKQVAHQTSPRCDFLPRVLFEITFLSASSAASCKEPILTTPRPSTIGSRRRFPIIWRGTIRSCSYWLVHDVIPQGRPMAVQTFLQDSRVGRTYFRLVQDRLEVEPIAWKAGPRTIPLRSINPEYFRGSRRFHRLYLIPTAIAAAGIGIVNYVLAQDELPNQLAIDGMVLVIAGTIGFVRGVRGVEYFQFFDHWKKPIFFIAYESANRSACEDFVRDLLDRIEHPDRGESVETVANVDPHSEAAARPTSENRWKVALTLGCLAAALPFVPEIDSMTGGLLFMVVFALEVGALAAAYLAYEAKEHGRHYALLGAVLSLIPFVTTIVLS